MNSGVYRNVWKSYLRQGDIARYRFQSHYIPRKFADKVIKNLMPKEKEQLQIMQRQREKIKQKSKRYVPSTVSLQVLGSGARGAPTSLYVSTDHTKYLFNCGEGTQRLAYEHRLRLAKLEHIFLTTPTWKNLGGLPGIALTVQDNGVPDIRIHGPRGCSDLFRAVERFVVLKDLTVGEASCSMDEPYVDQAMSVRYVFLSKSEGESSSESENEPVALDDVDYYAYEVNSNGKRSLSQERNDRKIARLETLLKGNRIEGSMAYVCKLHPKPGTLQLDKCVDMGVTPGPLFGDLKAGKDIILPDGRTILSTDVCSPMDPGPVFIVLECPNEDYLDSLTNCQAFAKHQTSSSDTADCANCVVHFTPERVLNDPRYRQWMEKFSSTTRHMIINEENLCTGSEAIHRIQHKLHLLHPNIFPFLDSEGMTIDEKRTKMGTILGDEEENIDVKSSKYEQAEAPTNDDKFPLINRVKTLDAMHLRPLTGFDTSGEVVITPRDYIDETFGVDGFLDALAELQTEINARTKSLDVKDEYPKIVMLGTGSCIPNKTRNTSGILLRLDEDRSVILDCGEGTAGQLVRFYGRKKVDKILSTIKAIYVSHLHADHHIGLVGLLNERERVTTEPVVILAPEQISSWLRIYDKRFEPIAKKYHLISNRELILNEENLSVSAKMQLKKILRDVRINTVHVKHCPHAFGVSLKMENGCKIVYSGDTMPCDALVELGADCDVLIHEATMEDELEHEARTKYHSTISQAIGVGERMRAKFILLTHFSQRYSKIPHLPDNGSASPNFSKVGIAYDNMQVSVSQLNLLPLLYPGLKIMFSEFCNLLEEKSHKRQIRLEREMRERIDAGESIAEKIG